MTQESITLEEWGRVTHFIELSPRDRRLAAQLSQDGKLHVDELRDGTRFESHEWVGVIEFETCRVTIVPKLADGNLGLVKLLEYTTGLEGLRRLPTERQIEVSGFDLLDLICALVVDSADRLARTGLLADYVNQEELLPVVRGRILSDRQVLSRFGRLDAIWCRFDDHVSDIWENQLVAVGLQHAARRSHDDRTRGRARRLSELFLDVCNPQYLDLRQRAAQRIYHRLNRRYREAHELTLFLLAGLGIDDVMASGDVRSFAFLIDMNTLFERFVSRLLEQLFPDMRVQSQSRDRSIIIDASTQRSYSSVIPDVLISSNRTPRRLPLDAKYKKYSQRRVTASDIYQVFLYAYAYGDAAQRTGLILYPSETGTLEELHLQVGRNERLLQSDVIAVGLPLPPLIRELTTELGPVADGLKTIIARHLLLPLDRPTLAVG